MHKPQRPTRPDLTPPTAPRPDAVRLRARRSPKLIALGVLLVVLGGLGAAALYTMNADHAAVIVMADDVRRGDVIEQGDLAVIEIPGSLTVPRLPAADLETLVGQRALTDLPSGSFPLQRHVGDDPLPDGETLVGLRLPLGRLPSSDIPVGTKVRIVGLAEGSEDAVEATTTARPSQLEDGSFALDIRVADGDADTVARLAAADMVAVVVVGD